MNVSLTPQLELYVKQKVEAGLYNSVSEVMREALRLLEEQDSLKEAKLEALRRELRIGRDELDRGEGSELDFEAIKARGRERFKQKQLEKGTSEQITKSTTG